jgi:hypothetical protein
MAARSKAPVPNRSETHLYSGAIPPGVKEPNRPAITHKGIIWKDDMERLLIAVLLRAHKAGIRFSFWAGGLSEATRQHYGGSCAALPTAAV